MNRIHYDGDPGAPKLSKPVYRTRFESDDAAYAELLEILIAAMRSPAKAPPPVRSSGTFGR